MTECLSCRDLETGEVFGDRETIYDDDRFRVVLEGRPRMPGHTIVVYKPHRPDFSALAPEEIADVFGICAQMANALKTALGAEKVYLNTMCDGPDPALTHLHVQLFPRYPGDAVGSNRFVLERGELSDGDRASLTARVRRAYLELSANN